MGRGDRIRGNLDAAARVPRGARAETERRTMGHQHNNGLKTAALFGAMWAVLLGIGWLLGGGTPKYLLLFTGLGLVMTAYSYWNSDKIAIRAMRARPVSEIEQPAHVPHRPRALDGRAAAHAAPVRLPDGRAQRVRHRPQPAERRRVLHRGHPAAARRARAARGARARAHARLQPRHPHVVGRRRRRRRHHVARAVRALLRRGQRPRPRRQPDRRPAPRVPRPDRRHDRSSSPSAAPASSTPTRTAPASPTTPSRSPRRCASSSRAPRRARSRRTASSSTSRTS